MIRIEYPDLPEMLCAEHIATTLNISRSKAYELMHTRDLHSIRIGRKLLTPKIHFLDWLNRQCNQ